MPTLPEKDNDAASSSPPDPPNDAPQGAMASGHAPASHSADAPLTRALQFFAEASNETLAASFAALLLVIVALFGRLGFVLVGIVVGVALHALWTGTLQLQGPGSGRSKGTRWAESGYETARRVLDWRAQQSSVAADAETDGARRPGLAHRRLDYSTLPPQTAAALAGLTDAVVRDYVCWWYSPILPDERSFVSAARDTLTAFLLAISSHVSRKRPADVFLDFLANTSSLMIVFLDELADALSISSPSPVATVDAVQEHLRSNPDGKLASILDAQAQEKKLRAVAEDLLKQFLEPQVFQCRPAYIFLREVLAGVVLKMTLESCSKPEWINGWIVYLLEEAGPAPAQVDGAGADLEGFGMANRGETSSGRNTIMERELLRNGVDEISAGSLQADQQMSAAELAMAEAIQQAARMNELIAEDARRHANAKDTAGSSTSDSGSTGRMATPDESETASTEFSRQSKTEDAVETPQKETPIEFPVASPEAESHRTPKFTSFDQLVPDRIPTALQLDHADAASPRSVDKNEPLSLHEATVAILDDSDSAGKAAHSSKANIEYMIQIEPASSSQPGWMIARKYVDFENLHEVLRRISVVAGVARFQNVHASLPAWKNRGKETLRDDLERYLQDALSHRQLAESEGMKRFLERNHSFGRPESSTPGKGGFPAAFGTMGKGMLGALANAPKGVGGVLGGVGALGQKRDGKRSANPSPAKQPGKAVPAGNTTMKSSITDPNQRDDSPDDTRSMRSVPLQQKHVPSTERLSGDGDTPSGSRMSSTPSLHAASNAESSMVSLSMDSPQQSPVPDLEDLHLPPLPSDIPDDYGSSMEAPEPTARRSRDEPDTGPTPRPSGSSSASLAPTPKPKPEPSGPAPDRSRARREAKPPLTLEETQVAVDLTFAVVNELYNLSSAWNIRRTLLVAAKNFINLDTIRALIQDGVIEAHTGDAAVAAYIRQVQDAAVPTPEQLSAWPRPPTPDEKESLRVKARRLLIERGLPAALTGVMGNAASREALGRVFDALQMDDVARGLVFGLLVQALRVVCQ